jgi:hypothetical protein
MFLVLLFIFYKSFGFLIYFFSEKKYKKKKKIKMAKKYRQYESCTQVFNFLHRIWKEKVDLKKKRHIWPIAENLLILIFL